MSPAEEKLKEIICKAVGPTGVGKTSLLLAYAMKKFPTEIDILNARRSCPSLYCVTVKVSSWDVELYDTSTNKDYANLRVWGYWDVHVFLLCFSVVLPSSVESIKTEWLPEVTHCRPWAPYILVGTQIDLRDDEITVEKLAQNNQKPITSEEGSKLASELKAVKYLECSVLTQEGLQDLMEEAVLTARAGPRKKSPKKKCKCLVL